MRIYNDFMTVQTVAKREFMIITSHVKEAMEKSGIREGFILVASLHSNASILVCDDEPGLLQDIDQWISQLAPHGDKYHHSPRSESNACVHLQALLLNRQAVVPITEGKLELGPWQQVIYAELDGQRPKRIHLKVLGE